jgi:hypothetical protein
MSAPPTLEELASLAKKHAEASERFDKEWEINSSVACGEPFLNAEDAFDNLHTAWSEFVRCKPREFSEIWARGMASHVR